MIGAGLSPRLALAAAFAAFAGGALGLAQPWAAGVIVDRLAPGGALGQIVLIGLALAAVGAVSAGLAYLGGRANQQLWMGWERHQMRRALGRFLASPPVRDLPPAGVVERLRGAAQAREALAAAGMTAAGAVAVIVASGGYLIWQAPLVGALALTGLLVISALAAVLYRGQTAARLRSAEAESAATGLLSVALRVRLDGGPGEAPRAMEDTWWRVHRQRLDGTTQAQAWRDGQRALDHVVSALAPAGLIAAAALLTPQMSPGTLASVFAAFGQCLMAAFGLSWAVGELSQAQEGWRMLRSLPGGRIRTAGPAPVSGAPAIEIEGLAFGYVPGRPVIRDLDLTLGPGETLAVTGPSGVGKSTLVRLMTGVVAPDRGTVRVAGVAPHLLNPDQRRFLIGVMTSDVPSFGGAIEDETGPGPAPLLDWARAISAAPKTQIALVRLFDGAPRLLILDDAFGPMEAAVLDAVFARAGEIGAAVVAVGHDPALAARCDRVLTLRQTSDAA